LSAASLVGPAALHLGGETCTNATSFYSLLDAAKLNNLDPALYIRDATLADARAEVRLPWDLIR
jgi:hypothetical protein